MVVNVSNYIRWAVYLDNHEAFTLAFNRVNRFISRFGREIDLARRLDVWIGDRRFGQAGGDSGGFVDDVTAG